jgi:hypothetical protein
MSLTRFEKVMKAASWEFSVRSRQYEIQWWRISRLVSGFNDNRKRTIRKSNVLTIDESMPPFKPRTTKNGGLPHLSFTKRKPKPLGTELKNICDGVHSVMLFCRNPSGKRRDAQEGLLQAYWCPALVCLARMHWCHFNLIRFTPLDHLQDQPISLCVKLHASQCLPEKYIQHSDTSFAEKDEFEWESISSLKNAGAPSLNFTPVRGTGQFP